MPDPMTGKQKLELILRDWESGAMDAAGTIENLVALIDALEQSDAVLPGEQSE